MIYLLCLNSILPFTIDPVSLVLLVHYPIVLCFFFFFYKYFFLVIIIIVEKPKRLLTVRVKLIYLSIHGIFIIYILFGEKDLKHKPQSTTSSPNRTHLSFNKTALDYLRATVTAAIHADSPLCRRKNKSSAILEVTNSKVTNVTLWVYNMII